MDLRSGVSHASLRTRLARAALMDPTSRQNAAIGLPSPFLPTLPPTKGSTGVIKSYILPGNKTGVVRVPATSTLAFHPINASSYGQMFVGSFEGDFNQFPLDVEATVKQFKASGVSNLLIDVTNNGGSSWFLMHSYPNAGKSDPGDPRWVRLSGFIPSSVPCWYSRWIPVRAPETLNASASLTEFLSGFQSTSRATPLAKEILKAGIKQRHNSSISFYAPDNCQSSQTSIWLNVTFVAGIFLNGTQMPVNYDYDDPSVPIAINGHIDATSQRFGV